MLRSTHIPSANAPPPLPAGWTEHKAPNGHTYYYNATTKESTYKRPGAGVPTPPTPSVPQDPRASYHQYAAVPNLADPAAANAFLAQYNPQNVRQGDAVRGGGGGRGRGGGGSHHAGGGDRPRPQPRDKPRTKVVIPGCEPWVLVYTKYGRRFAYNPEKKASYWRMPEKIMKGILELDIAGVRAKAAGQEQSAPEKPSVDEHAVAPGAASRPVEAPQEEEEEEQEELGSDYEEVEVTDNEDEDEDGEDSAHPSKRQRTEDPGDEDEDEQPVEFNEDDIAFQLQAMGEDYGLEPGEYDDGNAESWPEGAEGLQMSDVDARELFKDLLNDYRVNPYSPWDKLIDDGKVIDDPRYTVLPTMKARREVWEEWSREQIQVLKERRAKEEKRDPRLPYMAFLQAKASPKLYWPEFRRKFRKEAPLRDMSLSDKDREKWYREHVARLKLPLETLKKDLTALLRAIPPKDLHSQIVLENLPSQLLADVRYISLDAKTRDPLIQAYIDSLPPPPDAAEAEQDEAALKAAEERKRRENALAERERQVAEEKRRQKRQLEYRRAALREQERELEQAMRVDKKGLQSQLRAEKEKDAVEIATAAAPQESHGDAGDCDIQSVDVEEN